MTTIGSAVGAAVVLNDASVHDRHAVLHVDEGRVQISTHGSAVVHVNGKPVRHADLSGADNVVIGPFRIKVELVVQTGARPPAQKPSARAVPRPPPPPADEGTPQPELTELSGLQTPAVSLHTNRPASELDTAPPVPSTPPMSALHSAERAAEVMPELAPPSPAIKKADLAPTPRSPPQPVAPATTANPAPIDPATPRMPVAPAAPSPVPAPAESVAQVSPPAQRALHSSAEEPAVTAPRPTAPARPQNVAESGLAEPPQPPEELRTARVATPPVDDLRDVWADHSDVVAAEPPPPPAGPDDVPFADEIAALAPDDEIPEVEPDHALAELLPDEVNASTGLATANEIAPHPEVIAESEPDDAKSLAATPQSPYPSETDPTAIVPKMPVPPEEITDEGAHVPVEPPAQPPVVAAVSEQKAEPQADLQPALGAVEAFSGPWPEEELDEDELEELNFVPTFSLLDNVLEDPSSLDDTTRASALHDTPIVEVIAHRAGRLLEVDSVERNQRLEVFDPKSGQFGALVKVTRKGDAQVLFDADATGSVVIGGTSTDVSTFRTPENLADKKRNLHSFTLCQGDYAHLRPATGDAPRGYLVRFVRLPIPPAAKLDMRVTRESRTYVGLAFMVMMMVLGAVWLEAMIAPKKLLAMEEEVEFAEVTIKDLQLEKPEEPKPPEPEPPPPEPIQAKEAPPPKPVKTKKVIRRRRASRGPKRTAAQQQAAKALESLSNIAPSANRALSTRVSNIATTRVPSGASKRFRATGATSKLPGGDVVLSTSGGGGGRDTRSAARLLKGRTVGRISGGGGTGRVRGVVRKAPKRTIGRTGGRLSRAQIAKVVAAGTSAVQRCYERQLLKNPKLQGKIVYDWVISISGKVSSTRVRSSSLGSRKVATCISRVIKGWRFPKPVGGSVKVTYPFVFRAQGF